jgi:hypothetical protein
VKPHQRRHLQEKGVVAVVGKAVVKGGGGEDEEEEAIVNVGMEGVCSPETHRNANERRALSQRPPASAAIHLLQIPQSRIVVCARWHLRT